MVPTPQLILQAFLLPNHKIEIIIKAMDSEYDLGDKVILEGVNGYWEIVGIESFSGSIKRYILRIDGNHKNKKVDCVEMLCSEKALRRLTFRN